MTRPISRYACRNQHTHQNQMGNIIQHSTHRHSTRTHTHLQPGLRVFVPTMLDADRRALLQHAFLNYHPHQDRIAAAASAPHVLGRRNPATQCAMRTCVRVLAHQHLSSKVGTCMHRAGCWLLFLWGPTFSPVGVQSGDAHSATTGNTAVRAASSWCFLRTSAMYAVNLSNKW